MRNEPSALSGLGSSTRRQFLKGVAATGAALAFLGAGLRQVFQPLVALAAQGWEFNTDGNLQGWGQTNHITGLAVSGGSLNGTITGNDPYVHSPDNLNQSAADNKVKVRLENGTAGTFADLFFITNADQAWNEAKKQRVTIVANSPFTEYTFDMAPITGWTGTIKRLRLDPSQATGTFKVDYVRIEAPGAGGSITLTAAPVSTSQIDLSWNDITGETNYRIERSPDGVGGWVQVGPLNVANDVTFSDTGLTAGTQYFYRVVATN